MQITADLSFRNSVYNWFVPNDINVLHMCVSDSWRESCSKILQLDKIPQILASVWAPKTEQITGKISEGNI